MSTAGSVFAQLNLFLGCSISSMARRKPASDPEFARVVGNLLRMSPKLHKDEPKRRFGAADEKPDSRGSKKPAKK